MVVARSASRLCAVAGGQTGLGVGGALRTESDSCLEIARGMFALASDGRTGTMRTMSAMPSRRKQTQGQRRWNGKSSARRSLVAVAAAGLVGLFGGPCALAGVIDTSGLTTTNVLGKLFEVNFGSPPDYQWAVALNSTNAFFNTSDGIETFSLVSGAQLGVVSAPSLAVGGLAYDSALRAVNVDGNKLYTRSPVTGWDVPGIGLANSPTGARGAAKLGNWLWVLDGAGTTIKMMTNSPSGYQGVATVGLDHEYFGMGQIRGYTNQFNSVDLLLVDYGNYVDVLHLSSSMTNVASLSRWGFTNRFTDVPQG